MNIFCCYYWCLLVSFEPELNCCTKTCLLYLEYTIYELSKKFYHMQYFGAHPFSIMLQTVHLWQDSCAQLKKAEDEWEVLITYEMLAGRTAAGR